MKSATQPTLAFLAAVLGIILVAMVASEIGGLTKSLVHIGMATVGMLWMGWLSDPRHDAATDVRRRRNYVYILALFAGLMVLH